jgi:hypothetical protein
VGIVTQPRSIAFLATDDKTCNDKLEVIGETGFLIIPRSASRLRFTVQKRASGRASRSPQVQLPRRTVSKSSNSETLSTAKWCTRDPKSRRSTIVIFDSGDTQERPRKSHRVVAPRCRHGSAAEPGNLSRPLLALHSQTDQPVKVCTLRVSELGSADCSVRVGRKLRPTSIPAEIPMLVSETPENEYGTRAGTPGLPWC